MINFTPHSLKQDKALFSNKKIVLMASGIQYGKGVPLDSLVLTDNGYKEAGTLSIGDTLFDRNGAKTKIVGVYKQGLVSCFQIEFKKGHKIIVDENHLNIVVDPKNRKEHLLNTTELFNKECWWKNKEHGNSCSFPIINNPLEFTEKKVEIDPYVLGVLLANGSIVSGVVSFTSYDEEIVENVKECLPENITLTTSDKKSYSLIEKERQHNELGHPLNRIKNYLKDLKLFGHGAKTKFIPEVYKYNSIENRMKLLKGLMDCDGFVSKKNGQENNTGRQVKYYTISENLCRDFIFLIESLCGLAWYRIKKEPKYIYKGETRTGQDCYDISLTIPCNPFSLKRKAELFFIKNRTTKKYIKDIKQIGKRETVCFKVDSLTETFIVNDQVVTHNSTIGAVWIRKRIHEKWDKENNFLITTPTYKILKQATLPAFLKIMGDLGTYHAVDSIYTIKDGPTVYFRTGTDPNSPVGITNVEGIWCDEAGVYSLYFWENIQARASFRSCPIILTTSPYSLNWVYKELISSVQKNKRLDEIELIQAASYENPYFPKEEYERKKRTMDERRFRMMYGGEWLRQEGMVYDCFNDEEMLIDPYQLPSNTLYYGGVDWGHRDPFCLLIRAVIPNGWRIEISEIYKSGLRPEQIKLILLQKLNLFGVKAFYADPSRPDMIQELQCAGIPIFPAENDIQKGVDCHYELIKSGNYKIFKNSCPNLLDEMETYHYAEFEDLLPDQNSNKKKEIPVDQNNHACDAARYLSIMTEGKRKIEPIIPGGKTLSNHPADVFQRKLRKKDHDL